MFSPFGSGSSYHWWPYNVPGASTTSGGWRFVTSGEVGNITADAVKNKSLPCGDGRGYTTSQIFNYSWTDPSGAAHPFLLGTRNLFSDCTDYTSTISTVSGFANDGSGYKIVVVNDSVYGPQSETVYDNVGNEVSPQIIDRYGNYWSSDSNGNLIDDTGRTPVITTQNGNVTYYDVLAPNGTISNNGTRIRYTVTTASVPVNTDFQPYSQSDIYPWTSQNLLTPVQSILLPDGLSQYTFSYDGDGELSSVQLPTGGTVTYGYQNFVDSSNTENRWVHTRTLGTGTPTTITPSVVTQCANYTTGCVEHVTLHKPSGDETVYELTLNNGAWNTGQTVYTGAASAGHALSQTTSTNTYTNICGGISPCFGANYVSQSLGTTVLYSDPSQTSIPAVYSQTQSTYDPTMGKITDAKEWDFTTGTSPNATTAPSGTPARETQYSYTGYDLQAGSGAR